ncbi:MAG: DsbC family protein [Betaproteobacteria bacterium]|nr:DsbC family protein [Betaproteobacteria bacterium]
MTRLLALRFPSIFILGACTALIASHVVAPADAAPPGENSEKAKSPTSLTEAIRSVSDLSNDPAFRKSIETRLGVKVDSITQSPYLGLYEIFAEGEIIYTDEKASAFIINGTLIDSMTRKNVTQERMSKLSAVNFSELPLERAIKRVRGNGKRVLVTFEDPNCGYCKKMNRELKELDNVTIYTFLYPILSSDSLEKAKQIWCAPGRDKVWSDWIIEGKALPPKSDCDASAILQNRDYGQKLKITAVPTLFFQNGDRVVGGMPVPALEEKMSSAATSSAAKK